MKTTVCGVLCGCLAALALGGCDESTAADAGAGVDGASPMTDSGMMMGTDAGPMTMDGGGMTDGGGGGDCASAPADFGIGASGWTMLAELNARDLGIEVFDEGSSAQMVVRDCNVEVLQGDNGTDPWALVRYTNMDDGFELVAGPGIGPDNLEEVERFEVVGDHYFALGMEGSAPYVVTMPIGGVEFREVAWDGTGTEARGWAAFGDTVYLAWAGEPGGTVRATMAEVTGGTVATGAAATYFAQALYPFGTGLHTRGLGTGVGSVVDRACLDGVIDGGGGDTSACLTAETLDRIVVLPDVVVRRGTAQIETRTPGGSPATVAIASVPAAGGFDAASDEAGNLVVAYETDNTTVTIAHVTGLDGTPAADASYDEITNGRLEEAEILDVWTDGTHVLVLAFVMGVGSEVRLYGTAL